MKTIGDRIFEIRNFYFGNGRGSTTEFAKKVGEKNNTVSNWFGRKDGIGPNVIDKILAAFPEVDKGWLIGGNGEMLKVSSSKAMPVKNFESGVPYYNVDFIGGFDIIFNDQSVNPEYLIDFRPFNEATCWCNVTGHSMEPEINHGDIIAIKEIQDMSFILNGEIYAIVTSNNLRTIKRIGGSRKEGFVTLIPTNKDMGYEPQEIEKSRIIRLYQVLGSVKKF